MNNSAKSNLVKEHLLIRDKFHDFNAQYRLLIRTVAQDDIYNSIKYLILNLILGLLSLVIIVLYIYRILKKKVKIQEVLSLKNEELSKSNKEIEDKSQQINLKNSEIIKLYEETNTLNEELRQTLEEVRSNHERLESFNHELEKEVKKRTQEIENKNNELILERNKAKEADLLKSKFLANMSHEIRTPLNSIIGFSQLIDSNKNLSEDDTENFAFIKDNGFRLLNLIDDIIDMSKIESNQLKFVYTDFYPSNLIKKIKTEYNLIIKDSDIKVKFENSLPDDYLMHSDILRIEQIIKNLLNNAIKHSEATEIIIDLFELNDKLCFVIKDNGIGLEEEKLKVIFQRFYRDKSYNSEGAGLGLSICKGLVDQMEGTIGCKSEINKGCVFTFCLPINSSKINKKVIDVKSESALNNNQKILKNKEILIVEDEIANAQLLERFLGRYSVNLSFATTDVETMKILDRQNDIDLILMDIQLNNSKSGLEIIKDIRAKGLKMPIIVTSAFVMDLDFDKSLKSGSNAFVSKPFNLKYLISVIEEQLKTNI